MSINTELIHRWDRNEKGLLGISSLSLVVGLAAIALAVTALQAFAHQWGLDPKLFSHIGSEALFKGIAGFGGAALLIGAVVAVALYYKIRKAKQEEEAIFHNIQLDVSREYKEKSYDLRLNATFTIDTKTFSRTLLIYCKDDYTFYEFYKNSDAGDKAADKLEKKKFSGSRVGSKQKI